MPRLAKHVCADCTRSYHNKAELAAHRHRFHGDVAPQMYHCSQQGCVYSAPSRSNVTRHEREKHSTGAFEYVCRVCMGTTKGSRGRKDNVKRHTPGCMTRKGLTGTADNHSPVIVPMDADQVAIADAIAAAAANTTNTAVSAPAPAPAPAVPAPVLAPALADIAMEIDQEVQNNEPTGYGPATQEDPTLDSTAADVWLMSHLAQLQQAIPSGAEASSALSLESDPNSNTSSAAAADPDIDPEIFKIGNWSQEEQLVFGLFVDVEYQRQQEQQQQQQQA